MLCMTDKQTEAHEKISQELRRGMVILAVLSRLEEPQYGYSLMAELAERDFEVEQGTLYPLLRRLEDQGLLESSWDTAGSRPRRYYQINANGRATLAALTEEWRGLTEVMEKLLSAS
jgi:DNA-binding PadR family transcriptional regulator